MSQDKDIATPEGPLSWEAAYDALERGQPLQAEAIARALVEASAQRAPQSPRLAHDLSQLAMIHMSLHHFTQAAQALRLAWEIPAQEPDDVRARLTHGMNLGGALQVAGQHQEAEQVLRQSLEERRALYGEDHPGYAYGLNALADLLAESGSLQEAHDATEDALRIFWVNEHPHVAETLILLAWIRAGGQAQVLDQRLDRLPPDLQEAALQEAYSRAGRTDPQVASQAMAALWRWSQRHRGPHDRHTLNLATYVASLSRSAGDQALRMEALDYVLDAFRQVGTDEQEHSALLGKAQAHGDAGEAEQAEAIYQEAITLATRMEEDALLSGALRGFGLFLAQEGRRDEARDALERALALAPQGAPRGRALVALGVLLQHDGQPEAAALLQEATGLLPPEDEDAILGRRHLLANSQGQPCGCAATS